MKPFLSLMLIILSLPAEPRSLPVPGGIVVVPLDGADRYTEVSLMGHRGIFCIEEKERYAIVPVPLGTRKGRYAIRLKRERAKPVDLPVEIARKDYAEQHLVLRERRKVNPEFRDMRRIEREAIRKRRDKTFRSERPPKVDFLWPAKGKISSPFGLRRFFNGQPRAPHRGLDIAAPEGAPVRASEEGVVVDAGDFFFSGNLLFIEHGQGLMTLYAHLKRIVVKPGEKVQKGEVVGYVGRTGRATGPHLHFGVLIDGVYVDPSAFLP
ncbi:peptidoglycan DD-metalloendopeptidase family protein [Hydrogenimonas urashimensis]|uniref:peptidoglycan DD-metalloendopeptidase family protein n=1 Tax=Hydrogenimonas urashimensis TaxID=2740515 RepID=UPI001916B7B6|nr:peptidoglycan DD-metalloendopeptidase family protein [Hydrogenimonas urashimensis]